MLPHGYPVAVRPKTVLATLLIALASACGGPAAQDPAPSGEIDGPSEGGSGSGGHHPAPNAPRSGSGPNPSG